MAITPRAHHMSFPIADLDRSRAFYEGVLGFEEIPRPDFPFRGAWYRAGDCEVHLIEVPDGADVGSTPAGTNPIARHAAFAVDDYAACAEHLRALGPKPPAPRAIPVEFCDPILLDVFTDPVRTTAGQVYERSSIEAWFAAAHTTDPLTNLPLADLALTPVPELVEQIAAFRAAHPALFG